MRVFHSGTTTVEVWRYHVSKEWCVPETNQSLEPLDSEFLQILIHTLLILLGAHGLLIFIMRLAV